MLPRVEPELVVVADDVRRLLVVARGERGEARDLELRRLLGGEHRLAGQRLGPLKGGQGAEVPDAVEVRGSPSGPKDRVVDRRLGSRERRVAAGGVARELAQHASQGHALRVIGRFEKRLQRVDHVTIRDGQRLADDAEGHGFPGTGRFTQ